MTNVWYLNHPSEALDVSNHAPAAGVGRSRGHIKPGTTAIIVTKDSSLFEQRFAGRLNESIFVFRRVADGLQQWTQQPTTYFFCPLQSKDWGWTGFKVCKYISTHRTSGWTSVFVMASKWDEANRRWVRRCGGAGIVKDSPDGVFDVLAADTAIPKLPASPARTLDLDVVDRLFRQFMGPATGLFCGKARAMVAAGLLEAGDYARYLAAQLSDEKGVVFLDAAESTAADR